LAVSLIAIWKVETVEGGAVAAGTPVPAGGRTTFRDALRQVWEEPQARRFAVFIFVSMLAYGAQDLILDPFAGAVFGLTPGQSTKLSGIQHGGVLAGMLLVALAGTAFGGGRFGTLRAWTIAGCLGSALLLLGLAAAGFVGTAWPLRGWVFVLGMANGAYAIAAIGSMMALVGSGRASREGVRMGLWGAAQAIAFGLGGFLATVASDLARLLLGTPVLAYAAVFAIEAALFVVAAVLAMRLGGASAERAAAGRVRAPETYRVQASGS
jgi:BCD family chlorophyll transporter-like MFS transporter